MAGTPISETLHRLIHAYKRQLHEGIQQNDLPLPVTHIRVLKAICHIRNSTARSIARFMNRDKAQITRALNSLLASGFIEKTDNPDDQRSQFLIPTAAGKAMVLQIDAIEVQVAEKLTRGLGEQELAEFSRVSEIIIRNSSATNTTNNSSNME